MESPESSNLDLLKDSPSAKKSRDTSKESEKVRLVRSDVSQSVKEKIHSLPIPDIVKDKVEELYGYIKQKRTKIQVSLFLRQTSLPRN
jgi:hypothetical protein